MSRKATPSTPMRALMLGVLTGARSATPLAMLALHHDRPSLHGAWQQWPVFRARVGRGLLLTAAVGELVADKLPGTPSRVGVGPLAGRIVAGAIAGLAIDTVDGGRDRHTRRAPSARRDQRLQAAALGVLGALVGSYAGYFVRKGVVSATGRPDWCVALIEDAATLTGAAAAVTAD